MCSMELNLIMINKQWSTTSCNGNVVGDSSCHGCSSSVVGSSNSNGRNGCSGGSSGDDNNNTVLLK